VKLNAELIPTNVVPGSVVGATYEYRDLTANKPQAYFYWLEDVDLNGKTSIHGPEGVTRQ